MARIKIDDLPVAENLTPEQEELIQGAGLRSFQPSIESLETRQLMDAGLRGALLPGLTPPQGGAVLPVGQVRPLGSEIQVIGLDGLTGQQVPPRLMQGRLQQHISQADGQKLFDEVKQRFTKDMLNPTIIGRVNRWFLDDIKHNDSGFEIKGTQIVVHLKVGYGFWGPSNPAQSKMDFYYTFADHGNFGGAPIYKLVDARHTGYEGAFKGDLDPEGRKAMAGHFEGVKQYDPNAGKLNHDHAENALRQRIDEWLKGATVKRSDRSSWGPGSIDYVSMTRTADGFIFTCGVTTAKEHWEADTNPDFWKSLKGEIKLTFKYAGMANGKEQYICTDVTAGRHRNTPKEYDTFDRKWYYVVDGVAWVCGAPNRKTEWYSGGRLENFGIGDAAMIKAHFTTQDRQDVPTPNDVINPALGQAQKILSGLQFKNFSLTMSEDLDGGVRLKIHAERADGKGVDFSVDVKYDGANGFKCDRVSVDLHADFAMSDAEAAALVALHRDLHGNWR
jgi:hypothetical protein